MVPNSTTVRNPRAFFAQFGQHGEQSGVLIKPGKELLFFNTESRQYVTITPANIHLLLPLQEVSEHMAVYYEDLARAREERLAFTTAAAA